MRSSIILALVGASFMPALAHAQSDELTPPAPPAWLTPIPGGMTADDAARLAVDTAPAVRSADAQADAAEARAHQAVTMFAPRIEFTGSYTRINHVDLPPFEIPGLASVDNPFPQILDMFALRGTIAVPVSDYFLTIWPQYEGADGLARAARHQREAQRQTTAINAREAFYNLARARASEQVALASVESIEGTLRDVTSLLESGVGSRADVAQVRAQLASARAAVVASHGQATVAERALRRMLHMAPGAPIEIGEDLDAGEGTAVPEEARLVSQALDARAELAALREVVSARESLLRASIGTTLPRIALTGQFDTSSPNQRVVPQTTDIYTTWAVGAAVQWSPNDTAVGVSRIREAEANLTQAEEDLAALEDAVAVEAAQVIAALEAATEAQAAAREGVAAAQLALEDRSEMLRAGMATSTEATTARLALTQAQLQLLDASVNRRIALARIQRVLGRAAP
ncbi:MAG: TolC family protein [Sandaracinaceae bacterium]